MSFTSSVDRDKVVRFLSASSFTGLIALYFLKIAHKKSIGVTLKELKAIYTPLDTAGAYGFLVACSSFELINFTNNNSIINTTHYNQYLDELVYTSLLNKARELDNNKTTTISRTAAIDNINKRYEISV